MWMVVCDQELRGCITSVFGGGALLEQFSVQFCYSQLKKASWTVSDENNITETVL